MIAMILLPAMLLAVGGAGVAFKRSWFDNERFLRAQALAESDFIADSVSTLHDVFRSLAKGNTVDRVMSALRRDDRVELASGMDALFEQLSEFHHTSGIRLVQDGHVLYSRAAPTHLDSIAVPMVESVGVGRTFNIGAIGPDRAGGQIFRADYRDPVFPAGVELQLFVTERFLSRHNISEPGAAHTSSTLLIPSSAGDSALHQIPWGAEGSVIPLKQQELGTVVAEINEDNPFGWSSVLGSGYIGAIQRVPNTGWYVVVRMRETQIRLAPAVTAAVGLLSVLLVSVLIASRLANDYLGGVEGIRRRSEELIRKIDPDWQGNVVSVEDLMEIFDRLDRVIKGQHSMLSLELTRRAQELEVIRIRLMEANRLAAVGEIAHGVMHDIGQPLNVLRLMVEDLESYAQDGRIEVSGEDVKRLKNGVLRILRIQESIRNRARPPQKERRKMDLSEAVASTNNLYQPLARSHSIQLIQKVSHTAILINGNETQITQIVSNLVMNAIEALKDHASVRDRRIVVGLQETDDMAILTVEDNGPGMKDEAIDKAFEIGFTTKEAGTGFGLNACRRFVEEQHGGTIVIASEPGIGTTVTVTLPKYSTLAA